MARKSEEREEPNRGMERDRQEGGIEREPATDETAMSLDIRKYVVARTRDHLPKEESGEGDWRRCGSLL